MLTDLYQGFLFETKWYIQDNVIEDNNESLLYIVYPVLWYMWFQQTVDVEPI